MKILAHIRGIPIKKTPPLMLPYNKKLKPLLPHKRKAGLLCEVLFWKRFTAEDSTKLILTGRKSLKTIL